MPRIQDRIQEPTRNCEILEERAGDRFLLGIKLSHRNTHHDFVPHFKTSFPLDISLSIGYRIGSPDSERTTVVSLLSSTLDLRRSPSGFRFCA